MAAINPKLLERLKTKLGVGQSYIYRLIDQKVRETHLPRELAAIALASDRGLNVSRYASAEQLKEIRSSRAPAIAPVTVPVTVSTRPENARSVKRAPKKSERRPSNSVFVVHGRNLKARDEVFTFLRALGLSPIEWTQAIAMTRQASPYVGTVLDTAFREAAAVVVLLTPDDDAYLRPEFRGKREPAYERKPTGQARPNVLFEAGMAFGRNPSSTLLVQLGEVRPFSDVGGRHVLHLSDTPQKRQEFATKLRAAGCAVNEGGTDWLSAGRLKL